MTSISGHELERIAEAMKNPDPHLQVVLARWQGHDFTVRVNGKWRLEGFISYFKAVQEIVAAVDGTTSPGLPPQCLDPVQIARFFRIPLEEFAESGIPGSHTDGNFLSPIEGRLESRIGEMSALLSKIDGDLTTLVQQRTIKDFYTTDDLSRMFGKAPYTVREWCRLGRINAQKVPSLRGGEQEWRISHAELIRYQNEGLLPIPRKY